MTNRIEKGIETVASEVMAAIEATRAKIAGLADAVAHLGRGRKAVPVRVRGANHPVRAAGKAAAKHRSGGKMPQAKAPGRASNTPRRSAKKGGVER
jgi:hypothetical protein